MTRRLWDALDDDVLRTLHAQGRDAKWVARFMCVHVSTVHRRARELGVAFNRRHNWTKAEDAVLRRRYPSERTADIARDLGFKLPAIYNRAALLGLKKNAAFRELDRADHSRLARTNPAMRRSQFKKGRAPWNKGTHYVAGGRSAETRFKKGEMRGAAQRKYKPIGTERISWDGYLERKVTDAGTTNRARQRRWVAVHRLVWEQAHGRIPRRHVVRFKPGCRTTVAAEITADKLELVSQRENMLRNTLHRYPKPLVHAIQLRGALNRKINRLEGKHA